MVAVDAHALRVVALVRMRTRKDLLLAQVMVGSWDARHRNISTNISGKILDVHHTLRGVISLGRVHLLGLIDPEALTCLKFELLVVNLSDWYLLQGMQLRFNINLWCDFFRRMQTVFRNTHSYGLDLISEYFFELL